MATLTERMKALPKIDLHVHLDGSVKPELIMELAAEQGKKLPTSNPEELLRFMQADAHCDSLARYLETFHFVVGFLQTAEALEKAALQLVEQAAEQNIIYIEVRYAPQLHREQGLTIDEVLEAVLKGLREGERKYDVTARCIAICLRGHSEEQNLEVIEAASRYLNRGVVAVDLAGSEADYPPEQFEKVFELAKQLHLPITIHAGEAGGAGNVGTAVNRLGAGRIGHGVRVMENPDMLELVRALQIPLELCPASNIQTKAIESWEQYPFRELFDQGVKVTVNTDNLTVSNTNLTKEFEALQSRFRFTDEELCRIVRNAIDAVFLQDEEKAELRARMNLMLEKWQCDATNLSAP
ncbi:adenosine deaminase [Paenibacillus sp. HB172176]|uniref:adenosine deaminase n=1 Tax=Paenibacillus sp. HB172176 TaxID=2493690 RepID=UPI0014392B03|nr:adenosine deaminase [Paenibacillus sp. HB172176]